ncbi:MinD/ParA family protein [Microbacterium fluvii]|uniref:MinD/ParA family protein n=1 Tax=Microbacterium fluvii TaxID=415215 RepID=A0ABW2HHJ3_9MICO|nr:MinD/ParA family protein [Microbacterium fluvii]MCU4673621.1 MinD/ParA family protein [Microbacterium fluvii]
MTPDRTDLPPADEDDQNGVLTETGSLSSAGLGILGTHTAQVSVTLPAGDDDDLVDDDVIGDEVAYAIDEPAVDTIEGEIIDEPAGAVPTEEIHDAELVHDEADAAAPAIGDDAPEAAAAEEEPVAAESVADEPDDEVRAAPVGSTATWTLAPQTAVAAEPAEPAEPEPDLVEPAAEAAQPDATASAVVATTTGSHPATRREAHLLETPMTSKRVGEFEPDRESADLLTADRLLDPHHVVRPEPEGTWQHLVYSLSGHRINLGDGKRAKARKDLDRRIAAPLPGHARFVPVMSRKGGVGKTSVTTLLGMALADARDDRVIAIDANPDRGTLAERIAHRSGKTVRDLVRARGQVDGFNDVSTIVARDDTRLDVLASDSDPRVAEAFSDRDYHDVAAVAAHYYSIVLTDTGTGIVHSVMGATLELADQLVIIAGLTVDEARLASETLTWLESNGYAAAARNSVVVLNNSRPGAPLVRADELEAHFRTRVRSVVRVPYDPHIAAGSAIAFSDLQPATREAARQLAAVVVEGLRTATPTAA